MTPFPPYSATLICDNTLAMYLVNGQQATILHRDQSQSQISRHYARSLGLKFSSTLPNLFVSLSVATTSPGSSPTFFTFLVHLADHLAANLVLGNDWLALCRAAASTGNTLFAPGTYEASFNHSEQRNIRSAILRATIAS
ncbi:hypothetical protein C8R45DRAFT_1212412 [Mycena sanguinolenta]|nr:hypothetical protein C8R45DRAFT_1212412 [Mycena sanguinolenta]